MWDKRIEETKIKIFKMKTKNQILKKIGWLEDDIRILPDSPPSNIKKEFERTKIEMLRWVLR